MDTQAASVKLSFEKAKSNLVSVKLRVSYNRDQRRYAFPIKNGVMVSDKDFDRLLKYHEKGSERISEEIRLLYASLQPYIQKARDLAESIKPFSFDAFREAFYMTKENVTPLDQNDVIASLFSKGQSMRDEARIGNAVNYELTAKSIRRFVNSLSDDKRKELLNIPIPRKSANPKREVKLLFEHITPTFLKTYEQWMLKFGKTPQVRKEKITSKPKKQPEEEKIPDTQASITTVGIYCRHLRSVFNDAISSKTVNSDLYPFGKNGYTIPAGTNIKKALSIDDIQKLMGYECKEGSSMQRGLDLWVFSYLGNGMNMADICNLKWKDIDKKSNKLSFVRQKTVRTRKGNQQTIRVHLFRESWEIINRWGNPDRKPNDNVFPFISDSMTAERQRSVVQQVTKSTNKYMQKIADDLGITRRLGTYVARHSFVTVLLQSGANLSFIKEKIGHASTRTTEIYAGSLEGADTQKHIEALLLKGVL
jgi:site-specific recombinase XerD